MIRGGLVIKQMRKVRGLTQPEMADICFRSKNTVGRWETGESEPSFTEVFMAGSKMKFSDDEVFSIYSELKAV